MGKHKKEKKEKKARKKEKKHKKKEKKNRKDKDRPADEKAKSQKKAAAPAAAAAAAAAPHPLESLGSLLWRFAALPGELLGVLRALDGGQEVDLGGLADAEIREGLCTLLSGLGCDSGEGENAEKFSWKRTIPLMQLLAAVMDSSGLRLEDSPASLSLHEVRKFFYSKKELPDSSDSEGSNTSSQHQSWDEGEPGEEAIQAAKGALELLEGYAGEVGRPAAEVRAEANQLAAALLAGEGIDLAGVADARARAFLGRLFGHLGVPAGAAAAAAGGQGGGGGGAQEYRCGGGVGGGGRPGLAAFRRALLPAGEEGEGGGGGGGAGGGGGPRRAAAAAGPARPSAEQLARAREAMAAMPDPESSSDSSDDDAAGPMVLEKATRFGTADREQEEEILRKKREQQEDEWDEVQGKKKKRRRPKGPQQREEWMMTPGEAKSLIPGGLMPTNRTFQTKSLRGKNAEAAAGPALPVSKEQALENARVEEVLAKHKELRGDSLVERHQKEQEEEDKKEKKAKKKGPKVDPRKSKNISFDRDFLIEGASKKLDKSRAAELMKRAAGLDSRFSRSVSKSFL